MKNYLFVNNGFKIILKPMSAIFIGVTFVMGIVSIGMMLSSQYDMSQALSVLVMIPALVIIMFTIFSMYFLYVYFTFEIKEERIHIKKRFKTYEFDINELKSIKVNLKYREQNYIIFETNNQSYKILLIGPGGRFMYDEIFIVIDELKKTMIRL